MPNPASRRSLRSPNRWVEVEPPPSKATEALGLVTSSLKEAGPQITRLTQEMNDRNIAARFMADPRDVSLGEV